MGAFTDAAVAMFDDPAFGTTGLYTPAGGSPVAVKVLRGRNRVTTGEVGQVRTGGAKTNPFSLLVSEVPTKPRRDSVLIVYPESVSYTVESAEAAFRGEMWKLDVRPTV